MDALYQWFAEPLAFPFIQQALVIGIVVAIICAVLSCYLVLKGWSLMGDAISHAVLPGIVIAYLLAIPLAIGAFVSGIFCAVAVGYLKENSRIKEDTVMGIVFSGMFALGLVMFAKVETDQHLMHILFGDLLGITDNEFYQTLAISLVVLFVILVKRRDFLLYCFDASHARTVGFNIKVLHYSLLVLLALVIISAMQVVGVILVVAMLITPGITGYTLAKRFDRMLLIAIFTAVNSAFWGVFLSFHFDVATGPCIVLLQAVGFLGALGINKFRGAVLDND
ncbi:metal ABC transporter permease [Glaesserella parasuis]|nr:metal ABC transporter permease [Glaesserella parasuis]MCT8746556.1 metal ABC transporter permease [Glaesserella parasuis]MCT8747868.1 metal ABC transporter permease [Glaesserella parasuis]MCT8771171.1 metal ABC transporter permease [Glaesserella parasuis]MCT8778214.1 metal ABC transporter permease [Glaesserella parasuis]